MSKASSLINQKEQNNPTNQRNDWWGLWFGLVLILGISLRLYDLGAESYWVDEMYTVYEIQQTIPQIIESGRLDQPPGYYLPFHFWVQVFGLNETGTRSFSALAGIGSILLVYLVGQELFDRRTGLLSAFLMAISEFQIYYSQTARFYSFFEFTTLFSFLFYILAVRRKKIMFFAFNGLASILMVYSNIFGVFILAAQNLFFFLQWKKYKDMAIPWLMSQFFIVLAMLPYFYPLVFGESGMEGAAVLNIGNIPAPSPFHPFYAIYRFILPFHREGGWGLIVANYAVAGILLIAGIWIHLTRQGRDNWTASVKSVLPGLKKVADLPEKLLLLCFWLFFPILFPFIISITLVPIYKIYYTISAAPAFYLLLALGIVHLRKVVPIIVSTGVLVIMIAPGLGYYYVTDVNLQVRDAAEYVEKNTAPNDTIVFAPYGDYGLQNGIEQKLFEWYSTSALPGCSLTGQLVKSEAISEALTRCISGYDRFWVIIPDDQTESSERYKSFFLNSSYTTMQRIKEKQFIGLVAYLFEFKK